MIYVRMETKYRVRRRVAMLVLATAALGSGYGLGHVADFLAAHTGTKTSEVMP